MVFSSLEFLLLFLPLFLAVYFLCPSLKLRNAALIVFSLLFYSWGEPVMVLLMLLTTLVNYAGGLLIGRAQTAGGKKAWLWFACGLSLGFLLYYKYAGFLLENIGALLGRSFAFEAPALPIGISFYTFQALTYTVDVYRGKTDVQRSYFALLLYVCCFPQLIAGPIVQYSDVNEMLLSRESTPEGFTAGMKRFFFGLGKKVVLANFCGQALESCVLAAPGTRLSLLGAWLPALLYTFQLYYDFSAYSDMAIGLGQVLGFTYKENFNYPYLSLSPSEFWRRWHISLGSFFRDYVYIPLGGNRRGKARTVLNLFIVWALTGLWHGASWNFAVWGLFWFAAQQLDKLLPEAVQKRIPALIRGLVTFCLAVVGWVLFYYTDLSLGCLHIRDMFAAPALYDEGALRVLKQYALFLPVAVLFLFPVFPFVRDKVFRGRAGALGTVLACLVALLSLMLLVGQSFNPFIYFRF